jgi:predicted phosphodiesterase
MPEEIDWILFGHTHSPQNEIDAGIRLFNPGSAGKGNKGAAPSVGMLIQEKANDPFIGKIVML